MTPKFSKSALLIAAMATAASLSALGPASAKTYWISADVETVEVIPANFKIKKHHGVKHRHGFKHHGHAYHAHKHHGFKKKKHVSSRDKAKALILKKLF
ncbi:hypothetical protein [uncultured Tateyamaria sp.]|uniref:hypothetical protein n=1 Tax=Tateyamaria sp. 1078 TaxID=3417464 RepID=UPI00260C98BA|nr:hypothetical protein [uncultured Tateyamaria sp.]